MFHWGLGVYILRSKVVDESRSYYPASIIIVIGPIAALDMGGSSTQIVFLPGMQPKQQQQQQQQDATSCAAVETQSLSGMVEMKMYVRITGFGTIACGLWSREPASCGLSTYWSSSPASD
jgi:hypothetical protein